MVDSAEREQRNQEATVHVGNLDTLATEEIVWELFLQAGPLERVHVPRDKVTGEGMAFAFVEYSLERDADYAVKLLNSVKLFNRPIRVSKATQTTKALDVGANLFIGGLDETVDEIMLADVFSSFGTLIKTQVARDLASGASLGYGFISYDNFPSADAAIAAMNDQFLCNKQIRVMYAYKKGTTERHGSETERLLAESNAIHNPQQSSAAPSRSGANLIPLGRGGGGALMGAPMAMPPLAPPPPPGAGYSPAMMMPPPPPATGYMSMPPPPPVGGYMPMPPPPPPGPYGRGT